MREEQRLGEARGPAQGLAASGRRQDWDSGLSLRRPPHAAWLLVTHPGHVHPACGGRRPQGLARALPAGGSSRGQQGPASA